MQPRLFAYVLSLVADPSDAKDVVQECNSVILRKIGELKQSERFSAWSYRIAYYQSLSFLKKRKHYRRAFSESLIEQIADASEQVDEGSERRFIRLESCIGRLQERTRAIISDYYYGGLSVKEIAAKRALESNNVAQILFRARKVLFECMTQSEENDHG